MARRLFIVAIVAVCLGGPMVEIFDSWDQTSRDGNDTEANVLVVALCVGLAFATGTLIVVNQIRTLASRPAGTDSRTSPHHVAFLLPPSPASSPPAILRI